MNLLLILTIFTAVIFKFGICNEPSCFVQNTCYDKGSDKTYENGNFWYSAEQKCFGCICSEHKEYVVSCMEQLRGNKTNTRLIKNMGLLEKLLIEVPYSHHKNPDAPNIREEEVELTEDDAMHIQCNDVPKPFYDNSTRLLHFPRLKLVHYMFVTRQSYCCRKAAIPTDVHPLCKVKEIDRCNFEVVMRGNPNKKCQLPYLVL